MKNFFCFRAPQLCGQKGIALIAALMAICILTLIGITMLFVSTTETLILYSTQSKLANVYAAESGIEEARDRIKPLLNAGFLSLADPNKVTYLVSDPARIDPVSGSKDTNPYFDDSYFSQQTTTIVNAQLIQAGFAWVKIVPKTEARAGYSLNNTRPLKTVPVFFGYQRFQPDAELTQYVHTSVNALNYAGAPVFLVTAFARGSDGSQQKTQADLAAIPVPPIGAAFYSKDAISLDGHTIEVAGDDEDLARGNNLLGIESQSDISGDSSNVQGSPIPIRTHSNYDYDIDSLIGSLKAPLGKDIEQVAPAIAKLPDGSYAGEGLALGQTPATGDISQTVIANSGLAISNSTGQGILVINGNLTVTGSFVYYGLLIVKGSVSLTGGNLPGIEIHGAVISNSSGGNQLSVLNGNVRIVNNSTFIQKQFNAMNYVRLAIRNVY
jgi:hypothetical protein